MKKLISLIANAVLSMFGFFENWTKRREEKAAEKKKKQSIDQINKVRKSVVDGDEESLNRIIEGVRQRNSVENSGAASLFALGTILFAAMIFGFFFLCSGCITNKEPEMIVVPADRYVSRIEHDGIRGWFVPDATMADLMENYVKIQNLNEDRCNEKALE